MARLETPELSLGLDKCLHVIGTDGHFGKVYRACKDEDCKDCFVYKLGNITQKEIDMTTQVSNETSKLHGNKHITELIDIVKYNSLDEEQNVVEKFAIVMNEIYPYVEDETVFPNLLTLIESRFLENEENDIIWRQIILQIIGTLADIQTAIPNFRHNDLNLKNIMLSNPNEGHVCEFNSMTLKIVPKIHVTIIDFGFSSKVSTSRPIHSDIYTMVKTINDMIKTYKLNKLIVEWKIFADFVLKSVGKIRSMNELMEHPYFNMFLETKGGLRKTRRKNRRRHLNSKKHNR